MENRDLERVQRVLNVIPNDKFKLVSIDISYEDTEFFDRGVNIQIEAKDYNPGPIFDEDFDNLAQVLEEIPGMEIEADGNDEFIDITFNIK